MSKAMMINPEYGLYEKNGIAFASSRDVADTFRKGHNHVLRDIDTALATLGSLSADDLPKYGVITGEVDPSKFGQINFQRHTYKDEQGRRYPEYLMTKDGFTYIAMGFNGKRAAIFKVAYIRRFNDMEAFIKSLAASRMDFPAFTEAVIAAHDEPKNYHFSTEINLIYRLIFGMDAKQLRQKRGIAPGESVRPFLSAYEIKAVEELQRADIGLLIALPDYAQRKAALQRHYDRIQTTRLLTA